MRAVAYVYLCVLLRKYFLTDSVFLAPPLTAPILTLLGTQSPELTYSILHHVLLMISRAPAVFEPDFKTFFCRSNDPTYVKCLKIQILRDIVGEKNKYDIIAELRYVHLCYLRVHLLHK